jgi:hypothetical protein
LQIDCINPRRRTPGVGAGWSWREAITITTTRGGARRGGGSLREEFESQAKQAAQFFLLITESYS